MAREFINKVRKTLAEKGIPLDKGHRNFAKVCGVKVERMSLNEDGPDGSTVQSAEVIKTPNKPWNDSEPDPVNFVQRGDRHVGPWRSRGSRGRSTKYQNQRPSCFYAGVRNIFKELVRTSIVSLVGKKDMTAGTVTPRDRYFRFACFQYQSWYLNESGVMVSLQLNGYKQQ